jgi:hypothetical protein
VPSLADIDLNQLLQGTLVSRLTVFGIAGLEALAEDQAEVRLRDGPARNKVRCRRQ